MAQQRAHVSWWFYAIIHLIYMATGFKSGIFRSFKCYTCLYTGFIDDGFYAWHSPYQDFEIFAEELKCVDVLIQVIWSFLIKLSHITSL